MPQMANITVKAANGTTDVIFVAQSPAGGDGNPALWRVDAEGANAKVRPAVTVMSKWNSPKTARQLELVMTHPFAFTDSTTGLVTYKDQALARVFVTCPSVIPDTVLAEFAARLGNFVASTLIKDSVKTGFAPV